jgi:hypothetical protein
MAATRKLYCELAEEFSLALSRDDTCSDTVAHCVRKTADVLKRDASKFRYDYFFEACGLDSFGYVKGTASA